MPQMAGEARPPALTIDPPLLNSANPWATTSEDLDILHECRSTGAVTTRTSLIDGFNHQSSKHQYVFFDAASHDVTREFDPPSSTGNSSLNSLGYSPHTLDTYLAMIKAIDEDLTKQPAKGFIVSVTGSPGAVAECYKLIASAQLDISLPLSVEVNLSCPNIPNSPPPAYSGEALTGYLKALTAVISSNSQLPRLPFGLKTPPYTHSTEFEVLIDALLRSSASSPHGVCPVSFITATNTLGSCLVLPSSQPVPQGRTAVPVGDRSANEALSESPPTTFIASLPGSGLGGMAGAPLHPLALGNVATLRRMLDANSKQLGHIQLIGVGGVLDSDGYRRMRAVGAYAVGVGTGLGLKGVEVFQDIEKGLSGNW